MKEKQRKWKINILWLSWAIQMEISKSKARQRKDTEQGAVTWFLAPWMGNSEWSVEVVFESSQLEPLPCLPRV